MQNIQLVPVVELPHPKEAWDNAGNSPESTWHKLPDEWENYLSKVNVHSGYGLLESFPIGSGRYPLSQLSSSDIARIIELHTSDTSLEESCALFGGYVLAADREAVLIPQCCGTLSDFNSWEALARGETYSEYFCLEGHPSPEAISDGSLIIIRCADELENFEEPAPAKYLLDRLTLANAIQDAKTELDQFVFKLEEWGNVQGHQNAAAILVYSTS